MAHEQCCKYPNGPWQNKKGCLTCPGGIVRRLGGSLGPHCALKSTVWPAGMLSHCPGAWLLRAAPGRPPLSPVQEEPLLTGRPEVLGSKKPILQTCSPLHTPNLPGPGLMPQAAPTTSCCTHPGTRARALWGQPEGPGTRPGLESHSFFPGSSRGYLFQEALAYQPPPTPTALLPFSFCPRSPLHTPMGLRVAKQQRLPVFPVGGTPRTNELVTLSAHHLPTACP